MAQLRNKQVLYDSLIQFQSALQIKGGAAGTASDDFIIKSQLDAVEALVNSIEWQDSVLDADILTPPGSPSTGDRYLIDGVGTGAWAGQDNSIAEWDGSAWVFTAPTTGMFVSADDENTLLYYYGGASWSTKSFEATTASTGLTKVGFDIQLDSSAAGNGLDYTAGVLSVDAADGTITVGVGGIAVGSITASQVSDFTSASETAIFTAANFVDGTTIDFTVTAGDSVTAEVKDNSIDEDHLLGLGTGTAGQVLVSDGSLGFTWAADAGSLTEKRSVNASAVTSGNASLSVTAANVFGANNPSAKTIPQVFINGQLVKVTEDLAGSCFFGTSPAAAVAFASLAGTENLYWNGTIEGYDLDASDEVIVHYSID